MLTGWMLYTMWVVLGLIGLNWLVDMYRGLVGRTFTTDTLAGVLGPVLTTVLPLLVLSSLTIMDSTGWIILTGYYVTGVGVILKNLSLLKNKLF